MKARKQYFAQSPLSINTLQISIESPLGNKMKLLCRRQKVHPLPPSAASCGARPALGHRMRKPCWLRLSEPYKQGKGGAGKGILVRTVRGGLSKGGRCVAVDANAPEPMLFSLTHSALPSFS